MAQPGPPVRGRTIVVILGVVVVLAIIARNGSGPTTTGEPTSTPQPTATPEAACASDFTKCADNTELANNNETYKRAPFYCEDAAAAKALYGAPIWPSVLGINEGFGSYYPGTNYVTTGKAVLLEPDAQFQNAFGAKVHSRVICIYDLRNQQVDSVKVAPSDGSVLTNPN